MSCKVGKQTVNRSLTFGAWVRQLGGRMVGEGGDMEFTTEELSIAQNELFKISQNTRQSFKDTSDLYISLARSTQSLGKSQSDTLDVTNAINKAIIISGASSESARAALS